MEFSKEICQTNDDILYRTAADYAAEANKWVTTLCNVFGDDVFVSTVSVYYDNDIGTLYRWSIDIH